jgi:hypothetical protein
MWLNLETNLPVRNEMFGYNTLLGSHYDKYYVDYVTWEVGNKSIPADVFVPKGVQYNPSLCIVLASSIL